MVKKMKMPKELLPSWTEQKSTLKMRFPQLTDEDLNFDESKRHDMLTNLQIKVNRTTKELMTIMIIQ